jgi:CRP-like cAMP-binding protein
MDDSKVLKPEAIPSFEELLSDLSDAQVEKLSTYLDRQEYVPGETIFYQGDPSNCLHIVQVGTVEISKMSSEEGDEYTPLVELSEGNIFGEMSFLTESDRSASAVASTHVVLFSISRTNFVTIIDEHPKLACDIYDAITQVLCYRLRRTDDKLIRMSERVDRASSKTAPE